jgi:hypothetical protein
VRLLGNRDAQPLEFGGVGGELKQRRDLGVASQLGEGVRWSVYKIRDG